MCPDACLHLKNIAAVLADVAGGPQRACHVRAPVQLRDQLKLLKEDTASFPLSYCCACLRLALVLGVYSIIGVSFYSEKSEVISYRTEFEKRKQR